MPVHHWEAQVLLLLLFPSLLLEWWWWWGGRGNGIEEARQAFVAFTVMPCCDSRMLSKGEAHGILSSFFFFTFKLAAKKNATLDENPSCTVHELLHRKRSFLISQLALRPHLTTKKGRKKKRAFSFSPHNTTSSFSSSLRSLLLLSLSLFFFSHLYFCDPPYTFCRLPLSSHTD